MHKDVFLKEKCGLLVPILFILLVVSYSEGSLNQNKFDKKVVFPDHVDEYEDTLIWAVKLQLEDVKENFHGDINEYVESFTALGKKLSSETDAEYKNKVEALAKHLTNQEDFIFFGHVGEITGVFLLGFAMGQKSKNYTSEGIFSDEKSTDVQRVNISIDDLHRQHVTQLDEVAREKLKNDVEAIFDQHKNVAWHSRQKIVSRQKRCIHRPVLPDPYFKRQWHLCNTRRTSMDINVTGVWERNVTGAGVTVAVVDDGLEWTNPDLQENYSAEGSWDLNSDDPDPMPAENDVTNHHGTRCAGEIAAVKNSVCGVGVAYHAKVSGVRVLDGPMTDSLEASAFNKNFDVNHIYSCSWGPDDDGRTVDGPHILAQAAMHYGINFGRKGYGNIYVVASGNGGRSDDNCNFDGYANSLYTVTVGAVDEMGHMPYYAEQCASMLAVTFSSGSTIQQRSIVTTDWTLHGGNGCTSKHTGTSAAAPIAAGMIALMLQARPCLTWRDVQYIIAMTAQKVDVDEAHWQRNGAGLFHSHKHGFGLMKAWRLVNAAKVWEMVPWLTSFVHTSTKNDLQIPKSFHDPLIVTYNLTETAIRGYDLYVLEHVQVKVTVTHPRRGLLEISLISPSGTKSVLAAPRRLDNSTKGFSDWVFSTVRCWGESPLGTWKIIVMDTDKNDLGFGYVKNWQLKLYGTPMKPETFQSRLRQLDHAMSGQYLNSTFNLPCPPPPVQAKPDSPVSIKTLKVVALAGIFLFVMAVYETLESMFCYKDEKKEQQRQIGLLNAARRLSGRESFRDRNHDPSECRRLLDDEEEQIPLDIISTNQNHSTTEPENDIENEESPSFDVQRSVAYANEEDEILTHEKIHQGMKSHKYANGVEHYTDNVSSDSEVDLSNDQSKLLQSS